MPSIEAAPLPSDTRVSATAAVDREAPALRRAYLIALGLIVVPFVISAIVVGTHHPFSPISDQALIELHVRDVGVHPVTVGLYSRDGWAHPGPMLFYALAAPYRLFGSNMNALLVGTLIINAGVVVAMATVARRLAGTSFAMVLLLGTSIVLRAFGAEFLRDPWVLFVTVLPFGLFCLLTWAMTAGRIWALPATAVVASYLAQTHVGYLAIAPPGLVLGTVWLAVSIRRDTPERRRALFRAALGTLGLLAVLWAPAAWDQLFGTGNLSSIVQWFRAAEEGTHTLAEGARVSLAQFALVPDWITGTRHVGLFTGETTLIDSAPPPVLLVTFAAAAFITWKRHDDLLGRLFVVLVVMVVTSVVTTARTVGVMYDYRLQWTWMLGALVAVAVVWTAWRVVVDRWPGVSRALIPVVLTALTALAVAQTADAIKTNDSQLGFAPPAAAAVIDAARALDPDGGPIVLAAGSQVSGWFLQGVLDKFEDLGFDARVLGDSGEAFGSHRVWDRQPAQARLRVFAGFDLAGYEPEPGWNIIGYAGPRPLAQEARASGRNAAEQQRLLESYQRGEIDLEAYGRRINQLGRTASIAVLIVRTDQG